MLKFLGALSMLLSSLTAFAQFPMKEPEYVCSRMLEYNYREPCLDYVRARPRYFDKRALYVCDRYLSARDTMDCIQSVTNSTFQEVDLRNCDSYRDYHDTQRCINKYRIPVNTLSVHQFSELVKQPYSSFKR